MPDHAEPPHKRPKKPALKHDPASKFPRRAYERELMRLQGELVKIKEWVRTTRHARRDRVRRAATPRAKAARSSVSPST